MFRFNLEYSSFVKFLIWIKLLLLFICWFFFFPIFKFNPFTDAYIFLHKWFFSFLLSFKKLGVVSSIKLANCFEWFGYDYNNILFSFIGYPDYFLIIYILVLLIFIIYNSHMLNYLNFQKLIKLIIFGLFIEIWLLLQTLIFKNSFLVGNSQFLFSPWVIMFKLFVCIIAICIFFVMLDYFFFESLVLNYLF